MMRITFLLGLVLLTLAPTPTQAKRAVKFKPQNPLVLPAAKANEAYKLDLFTLLADQGSGDLVFYLDNAPSWLRLEPENSRNLVGSPTFNNIGNFSFKLSVKDGDTGDFNRNATLTVLALPQFSSDPIDLGAQTEGQAWSINLASFISNPQAGPFTFEAKNLPTWMSLTGSTLAGTPPWTQSHQHAVSYSGITVTATGPGGSKAVGARGVVNKFYKAPAWVSTPNSLEPAYEEKSYRQDAKLFARSFESGAVTFSKVEAPSWVSVNSDGMITGTPKRQNVGPVMVSIRLTQDVDGQHLDGGVAEFNFEVIEVLHPPVWKLDPVDLGRQKEDQSFSFNLSSLVTDPENSELTFSASGLPSWMTLTSRGVLSGTPPWTSQHVFAGPYSKIVFMVKAKGGNASTGARGEVQKTIKAPQWVAGSISISDVDEDATYSYDTSGHVRNFEEKPLTFTLVNAPSWLKVSASGLLVGTPKKADVGPVSVIARVTSVIDGTLYDGGTAALNFNVNAVNHPPEWLADPLDIEPAYTKKPYTQDLARSATDPDGDTPLAFEIIEGPAWATLTSSGVLSGTPATADAGPAFFIVSVKDPGGLQDRATVRLNVIKSPEAPKWKTPLVLTPANEDIAYTELLSKYVDNPDNLPLTFSLLSHNGFDWIGVSASGLLGGTPTERHVGINKIQVRVSSGQYSDSTDALVEVVHTNHSPYWVLDPIRISATEDQPLTKDISAYAADKDKGIFGDTLLFGLTAAPNNSNWLAVSPEGILTGTPGSDAVGEQQHVVRVSDNHGLYADVRVIITTTHVNHAPKWTQDPVVLDNAKEGTGYTATLSPFATDPDSGDTLRFQKISGSGADWVTVTASGLVTGTPARRDEGINRFRVRLFDASNLFADVTVQITVERVKHAPYWTANPIQLGDAFEDTLFTFDLAPYAKGDGDDDTLTFEKLNGPDWATVSSLGVITGVPQKNDAGKFTMTLKVTNDVGDAVSEGIGEVFLKNHPPVINAASLIFSVKEREIKKANLSDPLYIIDKDGDQLQCTTTTGVSFSVLDKACLLTISAKHEHVRPLPYALEFTVTDGEYTVSGSISITVLRDPQMPVCNDATFVAKTNEGFSESLKNHCSDPDGVPLTFESSGNWPAWLSLSTAGGLSGTPKDPDIGEKLIPFKATNDGLTAEARFTIRVIPGTQEDKFQIDAPVPGALAENLWVVDNSSSCSPLIKDLKKYSSSYYAALNRAGVTLRHSSVLLSSDARPDKWDGMPMIDPKIPNDPYLFGSMTPDVASDFNRRVDLSYSNWFCGNCYSSPIWSLHRFYQHVVEPELSSIYHNGYVTQNAPMDMMIITRQRDHYKTYTNKLPSMKHYTPSDFARDFISFHRKEGQNLRISAIAPECGHRPDSYEIGIGLYENSGDTATVASANAYKVLVDATKGSYYPTGCAFNMKAALEDFAKQVIFRAFVHANRVFKLTKQPTEIASIEVKLKGNILAGNTGSAGDQWRYHGDTNTIEIYWQHIDLDLLGPNDRVTIFYRVS